VWRGIIAFRDGLTAILLLALRHTRRNGAGRHAMRTPVLLGVSARVAGRRQKGVSHVQGGRDGRQPHTAVYDRRR